MVKKKKNHNAIIWAASTTAIYSRLIIASQFQFHFKIIIIKIIMM